MVTSGVPLVLLAAGGTGGHLFPAEALAIALKKRNIAVDLATDRRVAHYQFPARALHFIPSATLRGRDPLSLAKTATLLAFGTAKAWLLLGRIKPRAVIGFGGYPTVPPVLAATWRGIPTILHEQNGVMGRANRLLAARVTAIATGFRSLKNFNRHWEGKTTFTGNPVRPQVISAGSIPYEPPSDLKLRLVVFGGSQGARVMSEIVPAAVGHLDAQLGTRLSIVQQARPEDVESVRKTYHRLGVRAEVEPFFADLPRRIADAQLVVSRSGASTVAELSAIGRPAILVPLPHALDQDQSANAAALESAGGGICIEQNDFTAERLAAEIATLANDPARLARMAEASRAAGTSDAAERLADLVVKVAGI
ncbi:MAG TPA: undecaprenyldiphospho-muramoylpentapeptide beta-N-acetylglucosaminyltransferase [Pseudolabrys sp.]|nr:undecaprenyldiphospho-muramoylpentapeptide beta-N-acetylglucosaminyltransferase [Pseudolabrys sp.]